MAGPQIRQLVDYLGEIPMPKLARRSFFKGIDRRVLHLRRRHKLVTTGENTALWVGVGISLGLAMGALFDTNIVVGMIVGMVAGIVVGAALDARARKNNKVI